MKNAMRALFAVALLFIVVMSSGCAEKFFFSFKDEQALFNESYTFLAEEGSPAFLPGKGLVLDMARIICPLTFLGDATVTLSIHVDCSEFELARFSVRFWSGSPEKAHILELYLGNTVDQLYKMIELGTAAEKRVLEGPDIPGYHGPGDYKLKFVKKADRYSAYIGLSLLGSYDADDFFAGWLYISLSGELYGMTTADSFYVKDISVSYDEGVILH